MSRNLSKSQYIRGYQCVKSLWLYNHRKDLIPETPQSLQLIFDQGHAIGELAQRRYKGGTLIADDYLHIAEALKHTHRSGPLSDSATKTILGDLGYVYQNSEAGITATIDDLTAAGIVKPVGV